MAYQESRRRTVYTQMFWHGHGKDDDELANSLLACGCGGVARTGLDTKLLAMPGTLWEVMFGGTVFAFSLACSLRASL